MGILIKTTLFYVVAFANMATAALHRGDIAIIAMNTDAPASFSFVALTPIPLCEEILFTDKGWTAEGSFSNDGEGTLTWTALEDIAAGTIVNVAASSRGMISISPGSCNSPTINTDPTTAAATIDDGTTTIITGTFIGDDDDDDDDSTGSFFGDGTDTGTSQPAFSLQFTEGNFALTRRDQLFAYQLNSDDDDDTTPRFLFALNKGIWQDDATNLNIRTSLAPPSAGASVTVRPVFDNTINTGRRSGTQCELLEAITDRSLWTGSDAEPFPYPTGSYTVNSAPPQTQLAPGDVATILMNMSDNTFSFLALADIPCGSIIQFTDRGLTINQSFGLGEGVVSWKATTTVSSGTVVNIAAPNTASVGSVYTSGNFDLGTAGDQLFAYQGSDDNPHLLFGINNNDNGVWQPETNNVRTSAAPRPAPTNRLVDPNAACDTYLTQGSDLFLRNRGINLLNTADPNAAERGFDPEYDPVDDAYCFTEDYPVPSYSMFQQESMYSEYEVAFIEELADFSSVSEENNGVTNNRIPGMFLRMCFHDNTIDPGTQKFQDYVQNNIDQFDDEIWPKKWTGPFKFLPTSGGDASLLICPEERLHPNNNYDNTATRVLKTIQKHLKPKYPHLSYADLLHNGCKAATLFLTDADVSTFLETNPFTFGRKDACHIDVRCGERYSLCGGSEILPGLALSAPALNNWFVSRGMNECLWMSTMWTHTTMDNMASMCPIQQLTCRATQADVDEFVTAESALGSPNESKLYFEAGDNLDYFDFFLKPGSHQTKLPITDPEASSCDWDVNSERKPWPLTAVDCTLGLDNVQRQGESDLAVAITNFHRNGYNVVDILGCALSMLSGDGYKEGGICNTITAISCQSPNEHMFGSFFSYDADRSTAVPTVAVPHRDNIVVVWQSPSVRGTKENLLEIITNPGNWIGRNSPPFSFPTTTFVVAPPTLAPTPSPTFSPTLAPTPSPTFSPKIAPESNLEPGDIAVVLMNTDAPDAFTFVALSDIPSGQVIKFTDNGWTNAGAFQLGEGILTWVVNRDFSAGTVFNLVTGSPESRNAAVAGSADATGAIYISLPETTTATGRASASDPEGSFVLTVEGDFRLGTSDQLFVYQGTESNPSFIFALNNRDNGWQESGATDQGTSAEPPSGGAAVAVQRSNNIGYSGRTTGLRQCELLAAITTRNNWARRDTTRFEYPTKKYEVAPVEPDLAFGDIAIIMVNTGSATSTQTLVSFSFVALANIRCGEEIKFTDNGWTASDEFRTGEGVVTWTTDKPIARGTIVHVETNPNSASAGTIVSVTGSFQVNGSGDQLFAYQGPNSAPTFIFALNNNLDDWQSDSTNNRASTEPSAGSASVAVSHANNIRFGTGNTATMTGTKSSILAAISNPENWEGNNVTPFPRPTTTFIFGAAPTASPTAGPTASPTKAPVSPPVDCENPQGFAQSFFCLIQNFLALITILLGS